MPGQEKTIYYSLQLGQADKREESVLRVAVALQVTLMPHSLVTQHRGGKAISSMKILRMRCDLVRRWIINGQAGNKNSKL